MDRTKKGGRIKGVPNVITSELRQNISNFLDNNFERMQDDLNKLTPSTRLQILFKFYTLILPKIEDTENSTFKPFTIQIIESNGTDNKIIQ